jgi:hypothetical protein
MENLASRHVPSRPPLIDGSFADFAPLFPDFTPCLSRTPLGVVQLYFPLPPLEISGYVKTHLFTKKREK